MKTKTVTKLNLGTATKIMIVVGLVFAAGSLAMQVIPLGKITIDPPKAPPSAKPPLGIYTENPYPDDFITIISRMDATTQAMIGKFDVSLPPGYPYLNLVILQEVKSPEISGAFETLGLRIIDTATGEQIGADIWGGPRRPRLFAFYNDNLALAELPVLRRLTFQILARIPSSSYSSLPVSGKFVMNRISSANKPRARGGQRNGRMLELQEYYISL